MICSMSVSIQYGDNLSHPLSYLPTCYMASPSTSRYVQRPDWCRPLPAWAGLGGNKVSQKARRCEV